MTDTVRSGLIGGPTSDDQDFLHILVDRHQYLPQLKQSHESTPRVQRLLSHVSSGKQSI